MNNNKIQTIENVTSSKSLEVILHTHTHTPLGLFSGLMTDCEYIHQLMACFQYYPNNAKIIHGVVKVLNCTTHPIIRYNLY